MILHHVTECAGGVVVAAPAAHADGFGDGDLDMVDPPAVPYRFEQHVGEPQDQQVLHRLLAEIVVDPKYLVLLEYRSHLLVDLARAGEIPTDRLLQHDPG